MPLFVLSIKEHTIYFLFPLMKWKKKDIKYIKKCYLYHLDDMQVK